jgi:hypothetical protein
MKWTLEPRRRIGPWQVHEFDPETAKDMHEYGQPVERPVLRYHR